MAPGLYLTGGWGVEPTAKISDPPLLLFKKRKGVDFDPPSTPTHKFSHYIIVYTAVHSALTVCAQSV